MTWKFRDATGCQPEGKRLLWQKSPREDSAYMCIDGLAKENCTIARHILLFTTKITWWLIFYFVFCFSSLLLWSGCLSLNILKYNMFSIPFSLIMALLLSHACLWAFHLDLSDENIDWSAWDTWPLSHWEERGITFHRSIRTTGTGEDAEADDICLLQPSLCCTFICWEM